MYARPSFYNKLQNTFEQRMQVSENIKDIYDGQLYREWINNGFLSNCNYISFTWYTDGIPVYKSSNISLWPLYLTILTNYLSRTEKEERIS